MAKLHPLLRGFNVVFPLRDFVYLLQLEEYETAEYMGRLHRFFFRRGLERRDTLKWTARAGAVAAMTVAIFVFISVGYGLMTHSLAVSVVMFILLAFTLPIVVLVANIFTMPFFAVGRAMVWRRAARRVAAQPSLQIVVVAGSHGKTTTKNLIYDMVRFTHKTQLIGGNINTTTGIAKWVMNNVQPSTEVLIVEMDAYHPGEIAASCRITPPTIAVLTSIGDQHLLRFGSQEAITRGLAEAFAMPNSVRICGPKTASILSAAGVTADVRVVDAPTYRGAALPCDALSVSVQEDAGYAAAVADALNIPARFVEDACRNFAPPDRRQKPADVFGYEGIDDSYNISQATAHAGVEAAKAMAQKAGKKLVVLTAGIPELPPGMDTEVNTAYGAFLAARADAVVLLLSEYANAVRQGLGTTRTEQAQNMPEAIKQLQAHFPPSDFVLLFQPELTDASY